MSGRKPRPGGKLPARTAARTSSTRLPTGANGHGSSQPITIDGLTCLAGYLVSQAQVWTFRNFNRGLAPLDLRPAQYSALSVIRENPGLSQMALGQVLGMGRSGIVPLLDALEARALLTRGPAADRRSHALHLTAGGSVLLAQADVLVQKLESRIIDKVGRNNHQQLLKILAVFGRPDNDRS